MQQLLCFEDTPAFAKSPHNNVPFLSFPMISFYANKTIDQIAMNNLAIKMNDPKDTVTINEIVTQI